MKIRFYIFGIVCVFLTCSFASAEWARFSDYDNDGGCEFDRCDTDANCNAGQCHFCDTKSHICKKGSKYDGKDYDTYEKCKCVSRKREWATTENKCCPKGEYNSDGHCCKKDNNDDTKTEVWCEITQKCQPKKESCCPDGSVWDTSDEAKNYTGAETHVPGEGACCPETNWNTTYNVCCNMTLSFWEHDYNITCAEAWCKKLNGSWDTSDDAKNYESATVPGGGSCCVGSAHMVDQICCTQKHTTKYWTKEVVEQCCAGTWLYESTCTNIVAQQYCGSNGCCCPTWDSSFKTVGNTCCNGTQDYFLGKITETCCTASGKTWKYELGKYRCK